MRISVSSGILPYIAGRGSPLDKMAYKQAYLGLLLQIRTGRHPEHGMGPP